MLEVYISENKFKNKKKPFVFRSRNLQTFTQEDIIDAIAEAGTTFTKADAAGMFKVFEQVFKRFIERGHAVKLFMGTFRASASGTAETNSETFKPVIPKDPRTPKKDHNISLSFEPNEAYSEQLRNIAFKRLGFVKLSRPAITSISSAMINSDTPLIPGDYINISGRFLKFDFEDNSQGVFFKETDGTKSYKASNFTKATRVSITVQIPPELEPGTYTVKIRTQTESAFSQQIITVL
ncbi:DNA-binding domain-containing protein [Treponema sp.]|uniref:HU family DNA-binding protein n=1 Tax=Treponema sp. TaxID=166 RepID=UPI002580A732|nr:DNA-binding domain-containing protein [Treponema sp.]